MLAVLNIEDCECIGVFSVDPGMQRLQIRLLAMIKSYYQCQRVELSKKITDTQGWVMDQYNAVSHFDAVIDDPEFEVHGQKRSFKIERIPLVWQLSVDKPAENPEYHDAEALLREYPKHFGNEGKVEE